MNGIIDLHCDTILECYLRKESLDCRKGHINLEKMKAGGALAQCFAVFIPTGKAAERRNLAEEPWQLFLNCCECYERELEKNRECILPARNATELMDNYNNGKMSALLTVEDGVLIEEDIQRLEEMDKRGVVMMSLTWNYENTIGYPNNSDPQGHGLGLKDFGKEVVECMNDLGMIIDVSHLSEGGFWDVAEISPKPFVASHSCARSLCDHRRNLTDEQLRAVGEAGGVVGINFYAPFLACDCEDASMERIAQHMVHIADKAGIEALALGSDFDGIDTALEFGDYCGYPLLMDHLQNHFSDDDIEHIKNGNFMRVLRECRG